MPATQQEFRDAMAHLGAAVNIITTSGPGGRCGFTASAVCSVTDTPPMLLVCMNRSSAQHAAFQINGLLCVNVLGYHQQALSGLFAGKQAVSMEARFAAASWTSLTTGAPALDGAAVNIDCRIRETLDRGTHSIFLCEVESVRTGGDRQTGLIWFARDYHGVGTASTAPAQPAAQSQAA